MKPALFLFALLILSGLAPAQPKPPQQFLVISDIHFNPLADPALVPQLMAAEPSQWEALFSGDSGAPPQKFGDDSSWAIFSTLISGMQAIEPRPKVIILTGDVLAHKIQEKFASAAHGSDPTAFRSFIRKTFTFIGMELQKGSGFIPVVYTLGNNDEECGDYALQPGGAFLQDTAAMVQTLAQVTPEAMSQWVSTGSYTAPNPLARHHRIIVVNSNFWSRRYANSCVPQGDASDPGQTELNWLGNQLKEAKQHGDKVWLAYHIPPGIDGHSSARTKQTVTFFKPQYADGFSKLLDQYRKTIELNLAGHTHLDDIRLVKTEHTDTLVLINPGVSPNVGQNPAFRLITTDSKARPIDITTYYLPKLDSQKWETEYTTRATYGLKKIDARNYATLYQSMETSPDLSANWKLFYSVSRAAGVSSDKSYLRSLYCAMGNTTTETFQRCVTAPAP